MCERRARNGSRRVISEADLEGRRQEAAQMILESEIVTSALEDDEAEVLLNWALAQVEGCALSSQHMDGGEAREYIARRAGKVRRLMRMINDLVDEKDDLSRGDMVLALTHLLSLALEGLASQSAAGSQKSVSFENVH